MRFGEDATACWRSCGKTAEPASSRRKGNGLQGPSFVAGITVGCAAGLIALLVARVYESCEVVTMEDASGYRSRLLRRRHGDRAGASVPAADCDARPRLRRARARVGRDQGERGVHLPGEAGAELPATGAALSGALGMCVWTTFAIALTRVARVEETETLNETQVTPSSGGATNAAGDAFVVVSLNRTHYTAGVAFLLFALVFVAPFRRRGRKPSGCFARARASVPAGQHASVFLRALFAGVAAPFKRVKMMDFFLMDQIVSQTTALRDWLLVMLLMLGASEATRGGTRPSSR